MFTWNRNHPEFYKQAEELLVCNDPEIALHAKHLVENTMNSSFARARFLGFGESGFSPTIMHRVSYWLTSYGNVRVRSTGEMW